MSGAAAPSGQIGIVGRRNARKCGDVPSRRVRFECDECHKIPYPVPLTSSKDERIMRGFSRRRKATDMDALLVEDRVSGDREIIPPEELEATMVVVDRLELLFSVDHGLRPADETSFVIGWSLAAEVMIPVMEFMSRERVEMVDGLAAMNAALEITYYGGWADNPDDGWAIIEWSYAMEMAATDAGLVCDASSDAGMFWCYRAVR
jgi:hypothetical protein